MTIRFEPLGVTGAPLANETVLDVARRAGVPLGNSCGSVGVCARCRVRVIDGAENLGGATEIETQVAARRGFDPDERLACQAVVRGDCTVTTSYW